MLRVWCEYAALPDGVAAGVTISINDGRITTVNVAADAGSGPPTDAERVHGLTMAGFANGHSHAFHAMNRGTNHDAVGCTIIDELSIRKRRQESLWGITQMERLRATNPLLNDERSRNDAKVHFVGELDQPRLTGLAA